MKTIKQKCEIENIGILKNLSSDPILFWQHVKKLIPPKKG